MVEVPDNIKRIIDTFLKLLAANNFKIKEAYLFGSYSKGNFNEMSDIDLAIVSDSFEGNRIKDRDKVRNITLSVSSNIELLPYSTNDFSPDNPLVREIMETGIKFI